MGSGIASSYSSSSAAGRRLPSQGLIISTLLYPFYVPSHVQGIDQERVLALRASDVIMRGWSTGDEVHILSLLSFGPTNEQIQR